MRQYPRWRVSIAIGVRRSGCSTRRNLTSTRTDFSQAMYQVKGSCIIGFGGTASRSNPTAPVPATSHISSHPTVLTQSHCITNGMRPGTLDPCDQRCDVPARPCTLAPIPQSEERVSWCGSMSPSVNQVNSRLCWDDQIQILISWMCAGALIGLPG